MDAQLIQEMYDSFPDSEELKEFDTFFIGDGSRSLMKTGSKKTKNCQLTGVSSVADLVNQREEEEGEFEDSLKDDLQDYIPELSISSSIEDYFCKTKKDIFDVFGFVELKSKRLEGRPFREVDLIVSKDDRYLLTYLQSAGIVDFGVYDSIAQLRALSDLGFSEARFVQTDCCPLCEAYDGRIYNIDNALSLVSSGKHLVHENCLCKFIPVIRKRAEYVGAFNVDIESVYVGETLVENLPLEYKDELCDLIPMLEYDKVVFNTYREHSKSFTAESDGALLVEDGKTLHVCSDYLRNYSSLDYLQCWLSSEDSYTCLDEVLDEKVKSEDVYYLNGRKVVEVDGVYFDIETKERLD